MLCSGGESGDFAGVLGDLTAINSGGRLAINWGRRPPETVLETYFTGKRKGRLLGNQVLYPWLGIALRCFPELLPPMRLILPLAFKSVHISPLNTSLALFAETPLI